MFCFHIFLPLAHKAQVDIVAKSKNINQDPKPMDTGETLPNGWKIRAISGVDSSKLKIKKKS